MQTYGNKIWNDATDNDNKTVVKLKEKDLASLCRLLDNAGLNYYAYSSNGYSRLAFNSKDLEWFKRIVGKDLAEQLDYQLPSKPYHPNTRMNIFGTIEFRYIPHKKYFSGDPDLLLKMAEILTEKGIHFSGRIYTEKTAKLTISDENIDELHKIKDEISEKRSLKSHAVLALDQEDSIEAVRLHDELSARRSTIISRQTQTKNQNKATSASVEPKQMQHFHSIILQKNHFSHIKPYLNLYLDYSYQSDARKVILQSSSSLDDIKSAVAFAARHYEIIEELRQCGFDKTQINAIEEVIRAAAQQDVEITQYLNTDYSVDELNELSKPLIAYINANIIERMSNVGNVVNNLTDTIDLINDRLNERKFYENHEYNAAQKNAIAECVANGMSWDALQEIDESFSAEQIHTLADMFIKAIKGDIEPSSIADFVNDVKSGKYDETSMLRLKEISDAIGYIKGEIAQKISGMNAAEISLFIKVQLDRLTVLEREQERLEKYLQDQPIKQSDIDRLRAIEPKRKSVQNLLDTEVAQVPKFEKQQADKMGERSAFEMRKSDNAWRNDESRTVPVIEVKKRDSYDVYGDFKNKILQTGEYKNDDLNIMIGFYRQAVSETYAKAKQIENRNEPIEPKLALLYHSAELIKNAIGFDTQLSESKKKSPNSLFMHQLYGVCRFDNQMFLYKLSIDEFYSTDKQNEFQGTNDRVYNVKGIKITPVDFTGFQSHGTPSKDGSDLSGATVVSIPQLYSLVKTYDKNFYENPSAVGRAERLNELEIDRTVQAAVVQYAEPENDVTLSPLDTKSETQEIEFTAISEMDLTKQLDSLTAAALDRHSDLMLMLKNNFDQKNVALRSFADNHIDKLVYDLPMPDNEAFMLYYFSDKHHDSIVDDIFQKAYKETERLLKIEKFAKENGIPYSDNGNVDAEAKADIYAFDGSMSIEDFRKMQLLNMLAEIIDSDDDTPYKLIEAFDGAAMPGWEKGDNMPKLNRIKKALYDILGDEDKTEKAFSCIAKHKYNVSFESERKTNSLEFYFGEEKNSEWFTESDLLYDFVQKNPDCSFALGNAIVQYLDEKQHSERNVSELKAGWYKKTNFTISAIINNEGFNYSGRFDIGDGKDDGGGSLIDHIRTHNEGILKYTQYPFNQPEYKENAQKTLDIFVPFLEAHSELTAEEQRIFDDFKTNNPIRTREDVEKAQVKYQIYQLSADDKYHGIRFEGMEQLKKDGVQLNHEDYELVYEGAVGEFRGNGTLEDIYFKFNNNRPEDFKGHSLSVSDVVVLEIEGKQTAYFCDSLGFTEMPEFFRDKVLMQEKSKPSIISDFKAKTNEMFNPVSGYSPEAIETLVKEHINNIFAENGISAEVKALAVYGSRSRGIETDNSDLDIVAEIANSDIKEDALFNLLNEDKLEFGGIRVDINPIRVEETGTLEMYLENAEQYISEKQQITQAKKTENNVLNEYVTLHKVGDFYEIFGKDAEIGAEVLDLHMISKQGEPMVGFPDIKKDEFSEKLKRAGYSVVTDEQSALLNAAASAEEEAQISGSAKDDFTITDNSLGEGGAKAKFKANIEAIKCLKALESEHRPATSEEKEILSKYVGWGGISQAFDSENKSWSNEYKQLKELLTDDEFTAACESTLNSFYTSPIVIDSIYSALRQFGYNGGNLLEPSCGVGNFFGRMPEDLRSLSNLYGVEIDSLTGRIAKAIYNTANIQIKGFEKTDFQDGCFDVAVGNVPFGDLVFREENPIKVHPNNFYSTFCGSRMFLFSVSPLSRNL